MNRGDGFILACAFFWAVHLLVIGHLAPQMDPLKLAAIQFIIGSALAMIAALLTESRCQLFLEVSTKTLLHIRSIFPLPHLGQSIFLGSYSVIVRRTSNFFLQSRHTAELIFQGTCQRCN